MPKIARLAVIAALLATAAAPTPQRLWFGPGISELELEFPVAGQERRTLPDGTELFLVSGTVTNVSGETQTLPPVQMVLRAAGNRVVYTAEIAPPQQKIAAGEEVSIEQAFIDIPESARYAEFGWAPVSRQR